MANNSTPIARTSLDATVIYTFFAFIFLLLGVVAFRSFTGEDCSKVGFAVMSDGFRAGEVVTLKDTTFGAQSWEWDFGDNTPLAKIKSPIHVFDNPGKYTIKLVVNNSCDKQLTVTILPKKAPVQQLGEQLVLPIVKLPKRVYVGEPATFVADSSNASSFDWNFGETERTDASGKQVTYTFSTTGSKNVTVYVNGNSNVVTQSVNVQKRAANDAPVAGGGGGSANAPQAVEAPVAAANPLPAGVKAPLISDEDFMKLLNDVAKGKTKLEDLLTYSCGKGNITVTVNNAEKMTLTELFGKLKGEKKIYIKKSRNRTNANNCILDLEIETKKKLM
jgi:PKD repeat protein